MDEEPEMIGIEEYDTLEPGPESLGVMARMGLMRFGRWGGGLPKFSR